MAARIGWIGRRDSSEKTFPFRLIPKLAPPDRWDWTLPITMAFIIVVALIVAGILWSLK